ncbi:MAG TPA: hypothetical protein VL484_07850 [Vicinamibacterales bacterium]|jgi:hypothetical protein|nr:hypothetical protein [Vicinamibacterales bacterium]
MTLHGLLTLAVAAVVAAAPASAQSKRRPAPKKPAAHSAPAAPKTTTPDVKCPSLIGMGVKTIRSFCDVPAGTDPQQGVVVSLPPHAGAATLSFDLHARHTYSESQTKSGKGYSRYNAVIGVLTMKGDLLTRAGVQAEFRSAADLFDRIGGGAGPGGLKAVAPVGREQIFVTIPPDVDQVAILGETLDAVTPAGHETMVLPGRPVAVISDVLVKYTPAAARKKSDH